MNRERLKTNEMLLQNTVTRSLADDISQHQQTLRMMLANLSSSVQVESGNDIDDQHIQTPELRALLEDFVSSSNDIAYVTLLNANAKRTLRRPNRTGRFLAARTRARLPGRKPGKVL